MKYSRDRWLGYDQRFCQWAAANPGAIWARTDPTLWRTRRGQSKLVQILPQPVSPLGWLLHHLSKILPKEASSGKSLFHHHGVSGTVSPVCYEWNSNPTRCAPPRTWIHAHMLYCISNAKVAEKEHRALHWLRPQPRQMNTGPILWPNSYGNSYQPYL